ncbi:MAG: DivIVA domain-containing protein, partial [Clostridia bacterium]|nr:DivIVA domain-containing protein [Clostridia bacterium]
MANSEIFKTSFKGYNKEEVIAYIDSLNRQATMLQKELDEVHARLEQMEDEQREDREEQQRVAADA